MTRGRPGISIGMPVFNGEKYLREAISSILSQTFENFELIISDNASTDRTESICRDFAGRDPRVTYVRQPLNLGSLRNFEFVLKSASADFFMWAACDDVWSPDWVGQTLNVAQMHQCACYGRVHVIDDADRTIPHVANKRLIEFTGATLWRRMLYFIDPAMRGKANAFYSVFPTDLLRKASSKALFENPTINRLRFSDTLTLYAFLELSEIRSASGATMSKRIHSTSVGSADTGARERLRVFAFNPRDISRRLENLLDSIDWIHYYKLSSRIEILMISLLLPVLAANKLRWKILRKIR